MKVCLNCIILCMINRCPCVSNIFRQLKRFVTYYFSSFKINPTLIETQETFMTTIILNARNCINNFNIESTRKFHVFGYF